MSQLVHNNDVIFYSTFFYFPFKIEKSEIIKDVMPLFKIKDFGEWGEVPFELWQGGEDISDAKSLNNQEILYFHHYLSKIAYNLPGEKETKKFLKYYRLYNKQGEKIEYNKTYTIIIDGQDVGFYLSDLALYVFKDSSIGILSMGVKNNGCSLKDAMEFNMNFRLLYITDNEQLDEEKGKGRIFRHILIKNTPLQNEFSYAKYFVISTKDYLPENINSIVDSLIPCKYRTEYTPILDHRMVLHTLFCIDESQKECYKDDKYNLILSRILFVDKYDEGYAYDPCFMKDLLKKHIYTRWEHCGTLYGFCRYADVTTLFGRYYLVENNFRFVYYMMSVIALYYRCALIDFATRSSEVTKELIKPRKWTKNKLVKKLRKDFLKFSNVWYFRELTNQDQGIEMFDMHRKAYELDELYHLVKEEIVKLDEHIRMEQTGRLNKRIFCLTIIAAFLGILSITVGFFGMNFEYGWFKWIIGKP